MLRLNISVVILSPIPRNTLVSGFSNHCLKYLLIKWLRGLCDCFECFFCPVIAWLVTIRSKVVDMLFIWVDFRAGAREMTVALKV